jgi:sugar lactone lactonase YvrE
MFSSIELPSSDGEEKTMNNKRQIYFPAALLLASILLITAASTRLHADTGTCGGASITLPFTDVPTSNTFFCSIAAAYFSGLTNGTSATTYSPAASVTREQMAAFITRTQDSALRRGSLRAALDQWASPAFTSGGMTTLGDQPISVQSDGADLWVANHNDGTVSRVRASDGTLLEAWSSAIGASAVLVARGRIFVTGQTSPNGRLYRIDPKQPAGDVTTLTSTLGGPANSITTDGDFIWTANSTFSNSGGSVSKVDPGTGDVTTFTTGFSQPNGILYDGANIWVADVVAGTLLKLNSNGAILQTVVLGNGPQNPIFDGTNIWAPNAVSSSVTVVRASTGTVLATLSGNGLNFPTNAAFDGQRILVTNEIDDSVSLWKAADLTPLGSFNAGTGSNPLGACSDGINFWVTLAGTNKLARF